MPPTPHTTNGRTPKAPGWKTLLTTLSAAACTLLLIPGERSSARTHRPTDIDRNPATRADRLAEDVYRNCRLAEKGLDRRVFDLGLRGFDRLAAAGRVSTDSILTIVDFSKPSLDRRMYVIDLRKRSLLFQTVVAHGRNSGKEFARQFSNQHKSHQSSLGFYITRNTYQGGNGYSLLLDGCEKGFNDNARSRAIVLHGADYAEETPGNTLRGYLGRSFGCPAVPMSIHKDIIDNIKLGNPLFIYYPDADYLRRSPLLNG